MKRLFSFLAILAIIFASNCSRIPDNNDPVIGIWAKAEQISSDSNIEREWTFNDVYLGRFHERENNQLEVVTDFQWTQEDGVYTISYPGLENKLDDVVTMSSSEEGTILKNTKGEIIAIRK
jgi:hypothetical protein